MQRLNLEMSDGLFSDPEHMRDLAKLRLEQKRSCLDCEKRPFVRRHFAGALNSKMLYM